MNLFEAINQRRSIRKFSDKEIPYEILAFIIEMAYKIPSAGNLRPIELFFVKFDKPPAFIVVCADFEKTTVKYGQRGIRYVYMEAGHTAQNICLVATALGLGSCCVGAFDENEFKKKHNLQYEPIYMVAIGVPK